MLSLGKLLSQRDTQMFTSQSLLFQSAVVSRLPFLEVLCGPSAILSLGKLLQTVVALRKKQIHCLWLVCRLVSPKLCQRDNQKFASQSFLVQSAADFRLPFPKMLFGPSGMLSLGELQHG